MWYAVDPYYWIAAEMPFTILSICLPSLFFFYRRAKAHGLKSLFTFSTQSLQARLQGDQKPSSTEWMELAKHTSGHSEEGLHDGLDRRHVTDADVSTAEADITTFTSPSSTAILVSTSFGVLG
ncbi:MAG: hypothetical protein M1821_004753 [Bathelium mastoideum]|nr:MAG: hypothetical protein M1821_004753 [Bathelium mastoideum]KAI9692162.1 MAG: hypothetical protein M1822_006392 [Bathelium mastoideum]